MKLEMLIFLFVSLVANRYLLVGNMKNYFVHANKNNSVEQIRVSIKYHKQDKGGRETNILMCLFRLI